MLIHYSEYELMSWYGILVLQPAYLDNKNHDGI